jgi:hypothetical protein
VCVIVQVGKQFDLQVLLHKVDLYLNSQAHNMTTAYAIGPRGRVSDSTRSPSADVWKWFKLADGAGLTVCLPAIAKQIKQNKGTCAVDENLEGLSLAACNEVSEARLGVLGTCNVTDVARESPGTGPSSLLSSCTAPRHENQSNPEPKGSLADTRTAVPELFMSCFPCCLLHARCC